LVASLLGPKKSLDPGALGPVFVGVAEEIREAVAVQVGHFGIAEDPCAQRGRGGGDAQRSPGLHGLHDEVTAAGVGEDHGPGRRVSKGGDAHMVGAVLGGGIRGHLAVHARLKCSVAVSEEHHDVTGDRVRLHDVEVAVAVQIAHGNCMPGWHRPNDQAGLEGDGVAEQAAAVELTGEGRSRPVVVPIPGRHLLACPPLDEPSADDPPLVEPAVVVPPVEATVVVPPLVEAAVVPAPAVVVAAPVV
jgi:hypothetical protein